MKPGQHLSIEALPEDLLGQHIRNRFFFLALAHFRVAQPLEIV